MKVSMRGAITWASDNPVLSADEIGVEAIKVANDGSLTFEVDPETGQPVARFKSGDGQSSWNALPYADRLLVISDQAEYFDLAEQAKTLAEEAQVRANSAGRIAEAAFIAAENAQEVVGRPHAATHAGGGLDAVTPESIGAAPEGHEHSNMAGHELGEFKLWPFRADMLPFGWYFGNGDRYSLDSPQGQALSGLSDEYKSDWSISITGEEGQETINVPNYFHVNGRGFFTRAVNGLGRRPGSIEEDAFQGHRHPPLNGSNYVVNPGGWNGAGGGFGARYDGGDTTGDPAEGLHGAPRLDDETRPVNIGLTPAIYLGV